MEIFPACSFRLQLIPANSEYRQFCVELCIKNQCKRAISVAYLTDFSFEILLRFSQTIPLSFLFCTTVQKMKNNYKFKSRGPVLKEQVKNCSSPHANFVEPARMMIRGGAMNSTINTHRMNQLLSCCCQARYENAFSGIMLILPDECFHNVKLTATRKQLQSNLSLRPPDKSDHLKIADTQFQSLHFADSNVRTAF